MSKNQGKQEAFNYAKSLQTYRLKAFLYSAKTEINLYEHNVWISMI